MNAVQIRGEDQVLSVGNRMIESGTHVSVRCRVQVSQMCPNGKETQQFHSALSPYRITMGSGANCSGIGRCCKVPT